MTFRLPALIQTACDWLIERINTLNEGADDFLPKLSEPVQTGRGWPAAPLHEAKVRC